LFHFHTSPTTEFYTLSLHDALPISHSLDDVMRALYTKYYRQNKGFLTADLLNELRAAGMPDVDTFYRRYIDGRDSLPYETVFARSEEHTSELQSRSDLVCRLLLEKK